MIDELEAALETLREADPRSLADTASIERLHRALAALEAVATRAAAAAEAAGEWAADGARSPGAWLAWRCSLPPALARRRLRLGRALRHLPATEAAWLAGDIGADHARALARARTEATADALARDEALLVDQARTQLFSGFVRVLRYWSHHADPDGAEQEAGRQWDERRVHLSAGYEGTWVLDGLLDPVSGAVVAEALGRVEQELFAEQWAEARRRHGPAAGSAHLPSTPGQRRCDALVELCRRAQSVPAGARRPVPLFSVYVGEASLARLCQLADGTVVAPGALVPWLGEAEVERVVFEAPSRPLDVGRRRRLFAGATRRAVQLRDRECFHPSCDLPAERCQVDHVIPWSAGGPTTVDNGRVACGFHNRERHSRPP